MQKYRVILLIGALLFSIFIFSGCTQPEKQINIALITGTGGLGDKSFNDGAYAGLVKARDELEVNISVTEPKEIADYEPSIEAYASEGIYDLIISIGFDQMDALAKVANKSEYKDQNFALVDEAILNQKYDNIANINFYEHEGSFLVGYVAANVSATKKLGFVGGMDIPLIRRFAAGYQAGAEYFDDSATVSIKYVGGWGDTATGKTLAEEQIEADADVIFIAAGKSGLGSMTAVNESAGVYAIGVDVDQDETLPEYKDKILCSMLKRVDNAVFDQINRTVEGTFEGGKSYYYGLAEDGVEVSDDPTMKKILGTGITAILEDLKTAIINGTIKVPDDLT
ncbi:MAG: BMP family protein [Promethearchaeota archaeon]